MPKFLTNRWHGQHILWGFIFMLLLVIVLFFYEWVIGIIALVGLGGLVYYSSVAEKAFREEFSQYIMTLSHRVKKAGKEAVRQMPIGMLVYNEDGVIEWHNPFVGKMLEKDSVSGEKLIHLFPVMEHEKRKEFPIEWNGRFYLVQLKEEERLIYFTDITDYKKLYDRYNEEKLAVGILMLDNLDEMTQTMDEQTRSVLLARVVSAITEWSRKNGIFLRRMASDRFLILMDQKVLKQLEQNRFEILDEIRDLTKDYKIPLTLSIGIGSGTNSFVELGSLAQTSLDVALGRGGDQAAVKYGERLTFYGGRSNAVEKRTRVRARVISHAFRELVKESENVVIMGHKIPDMDSIGAAIGVLKAAQICNKEGYIVWEGENPSIHRMMEELKKHEEIYKWFITPEEAMNIINSKTLAVVVDTHKSSMVAEPKLLDRTDRIFVVDHHRRGEEFINEAILVYIEPYASSTCELVAELLQYIHERVSLDVVESTAILAGIVVDTKSFALRTGARTFEAASFLRRYGADATLIQRMLKEDLNAYIEKAEIIKHAEVIYDHVAIAVAESGKAYSQLLIAQVADTLLNMTNIMASFVICERSDGKIGISARSLGQINVQIIMEAMGGGGHFSNAACQIEGTLEEAEQRLKEILQKTDKEEGLFE